VTGGSQYDLVGLAERASERHVVVIGAGASGLVAAREMARRGIRVTVLEAAEKAGGAIRSGEVAGIGLDLGAESFATRGGHVQTLVDELGLAGDVVEPDHSAGGAWVAGVPGIGSAPLPKGGILGIPSNPFADDVRRVIGWGGAWRAYLDRVRPNLRIGHATSLGQLVRSRMGGKVLDRLVAPVTSGVYSAAADDIDPAIAAPGLNAALTRTGSLAGAVLELQEQRKAAPGGAVKGLRGGMGRLVEALATDIVDRGGEVRTGVAVTEISPGDDTEWRVVTDQTTTDDDGGQAPLTFDADAVIVATEEAPARRLLSPLTGSGLAAEPPAAGPAVAIVTLVVDVPALDAAPRGTGVLTVPGSHRAKALTHATAKWAWVRDAADAGTHVVRVSFGSIAEDPATDGLAPEQQVELARAEASKLLGTEIPAAAIRGSRLERFQQSQPAATHGHREQTEKAREAIRGIPTLGAVGAWLSGTGLAQVVPDAKAETDRVRRAVLFGDQ
jgi:oxygen-dependent protoporphyrinogen oxidase